MIREVVLLVVGFFVARVLSPVGLELNQSMVFGLLLSLVLFVVGCYLPLHSIEAGLWNAKRKEI